MWAAAGRGLEPGRRPLTPAILLPHCPQAQVQYVEGNSGSGQRLAVTVQLPNGQVLDLSGDTAGPAAQTIDVEWRSVDDK